MATRPPLDFKNVQGDILGRGLPRKAKTYFFFQITDVPKFRRDLYNLTITSVADALEQWKEIDMHKKKRLPGLVELSGVNIAFSHFGFEVMGIEDKKLADNRPSEAGPEYKDPFLGGQLYDSQFLNDKGTGKGDNFQPQEWITGFKNKIHGVIVVTGDSLNTVKTKLGDVQKIFGFPGGSSSIASEEGMTIPGEVINGRDDDEHFGFKDGVSNPSVIGFDDMALPNGPPLPHGPPPVRPGIILLGREGDSVSDRDDWQRDGSFLAFRYLLQLVPEFDKFLRDNPIHMPGLTEEKRSELLGARLMGRWKSGAPVDLRPFSDDPELGNDKQESNHFSYAAEKDIQKLCPFASHIRKTHPRNDISAKAVEASRIIRHGIPFGPVPSTEEMRKGKTDPGQSRGLLFGCYQSSISRGFRFIQIFWANNVNFISKGTGYDPIIGQAPNAGERTLTGIDPDDPTVSLTLREQWVIAKGGEYFFSPSILALKETIATPPNV